jgi:hypothetical protein
MKKDLLGRPRGRWEDNISMDDVMDWMNVTVAAFCEHRIELCAVYVSSVTVMKTVGICICNK